MVNIKQTTLTDNQSLKNCTLSQNGNLSIIKKTGQSNFAKLIECNSIQYSLRHLGTIDADEIPNMTTLSHLGTTAINLCRIWANFQIRPIGRIL